MTQEKQPNIVFILADDTGYGDPRCYNPDSLIPTPHIDRLAAEGTRFTDAHSPCALCTPTRYGILTGRYYWRTPKGHALVMPYEPPVIEESRPTLPKMLKSAGYVTACIGKWHLGLNYPESGQPEGVYTQDEDRVDFSRPLTGGPVDVGFDYFFGTAGCSTSDSPYCFIENDKTVGIPSIKSDEELHKLPGFYPGLMVPGWVEEEVDYEHMRKAVEFLDGHLSTNGDAPFFIYLALSAPHNPWLPPVDAQGVSSEGPRGDMNVLVDRCVGTMREALEERGILDDTLLIFTSDNGPMKGEKQQRSAGSLRGYKNTAFEGGHRIPFVARWPGHVPAGAVSNRTLCLTDIFATCADLCDREMPVDSAEDSFTMLQVFLGEERDAAQRPSLVSDTGGFASRVGDFAIREGDWKLIILAGRDDDQLVKRKVPIEDAIDGKLLFNLAEDPGETENVIRQNAEIADRLEALLDVIKRRGSRYAAAPTSAGDSDRTAK